MAKTAMGHNTGRLWMSRVYNDLDRDPECDRFMSILAKEKQKYSDVAALTGLAVTTVTNLAEGKTRYARHSTFAKLAAGLNFKYTLQRDEKPDYEIEIPKARQERKTYYDYLKKKRSNGHKK